MTLGLIYAKGQGVKQDFAEAANWYRKAAEKGNAFAQTNLGLFYAQGPRRDAGTMPRQRNGTVKRPIKDRHSPPAAWRCCTPKVRA